MFFFFYYSMITEQIHQLSECVDVKCEHVGVSAMKMFNKPLTLATLGNMDDSNAVPSNTLQAGFIARWWKPLYVFNKSGCQGQQNLHGSTRRRPTCRWNDIRGQKLCLPLRVMDAFREGRNKEQPLFCYPSFDMGKIACCCCCWTVALRFLWCHVIWWSHPVNQPKAGCHLRADPDCCHCKVKPKLLLTAAGRWTTLQVMSGSCGLRCCCGDVNEEITQSDCGCVVPFLAPRPGLCFSKADIWGVTDEFRIRACSWRWGRKCSFNPEPFLLQSKQITPFPVSRMQPEQRPADVTLWPADTMVQPVQFNHVGQEIKT